MKLEDQKLAACDVPHSIIARRASRSGISSRNPGEDMKSYFRVEGSSTSLTGVLCVVLVSVGLSLPSLAQVSVLTHHNDNSRTGQNLSETYLTPATVNTGHFGELFSRPVDGIVIGEPLYVPNLTINGATHNVVFVVTLHDGVYAFDADSNTGSNASPLWYNSLIDPPAVTTVPIADEGCGADTPYPEIGIMGTPVIDPTTNTMYLVAKTLESGNYFFRLHALNITTGQDTFGGPVILQGSYVSNGKTVTFTAQHRMQRPALLLSNGAIYIGFGNMGCKASPPSTGWLMAYSASTLQQLTILDVGPAEYALPGIWMGGDGPAVDSNGNVYVATGDGIFDYNVGGLDYGDTLMKLSLDSGSLSLVDYFTPYNQSDLDVNDLDLGSSGAVLLPTQPGPNPNLAVIAGKGGMIYLVNLDSMGEYNSVVDNVVQEVPFDNPGSEIFGGAAYWNQFVYFGSGGVPIEAFSLSNGLLSTSPTMTTKGKYYIPSLFSISADGDTNGILWAVAQNYEKGGVHTGASLDAFNASTLEALYISAPPRDPIDPGFHLTLPMVANGKVYVGTQDNLTVLGLFSEIVANEGDNQTGTVGTELPKPLRVVVKAAYTGTLMPGVTVNFSDGGSGGTFSTPSPVTNSKGVATTNYTLPGTPGTDTITASSPGFTTAYWTETATAEALPSPEAGVARAQ
jgi:hypothetical protein